MIGINQTSLTHIDSRHSRSVQAPKNYTSATLYLLSISVLWRLSTIFRCRGIHFTGHCFDPDNPDNINLPPDELTLVFALDNLDDLNDAVKLQFLPIEMRKIRKVHTYQGYNYPRAYDDISVVELSKVQWFWLWRLSNFQKIFEKPKWEK